MLVKGQVAVLFHFHFGIAMTVLACLCVTEDELRIIFFNFLMEIF